MSDKPKLLKVIGIDGREYYISKNDYERGRNNLPLYTRTGIHYLDLKVTHPARSGGITILRSNIQSVSDA